MPEETKAIDYVMEAASGPHFSGLRLDGLLSSPPPSSSSFSPSHRSSTSASSAFADSNAPRQPFVIGVSGGTASGKTTVCDMIIQQLHDHRVVLVNQDSFYRGLTPEESERVHEYNFDHPDAFDTEQLLDCIIKLKCGQSVHVPIYDFKEHRRSLDSFRQVNASDVIILEGILVFHDQRVRNLMNMKIFVDTDADVRLARRIRRDTVERGRDVNSVLEQYAKFVKPAFDDFVLPSKKYADVIIPRGGDNHVAIDLIVQHIHTKLGQHDLCKIYPNVYVIQSTFQIRGMHTLIRDRDISKHDFVFYSDRLIRLVVEHGLGHFPFTEKQIVTPTGSVYTGVDFCKKLCGVSIVRSGESMENALRACCKGIKIGKILIHQYSAEEKTHKKLKEEGLALLGIVGLKDPCRPGVKKAVEACKSAGVAIKMITGDNVFTAKAIAAECGILEHGDQASCDGEVVEGVEFRNYTEEERMKRIDNIKVMARSSPFDKLLMVQCLKQKGHVVAVTGDGTNDAPALKEADIGLSMGIQGTEVAKESSDIVILDDNFTSVATVLRWGRCVYNNIQKFIQFQLTVNVAALVINFVAAVSAGEVPLTTVQLLWVNLIMDTLGALALATERPSDELMKKPPVGRTAPLITNVMWRNLLAQSMFQIAILLILQFNGESMFNVTEEVNDTLIFNIFVLSQVFNEFNARSTEKKNVFKGIHRNRLFMGIVGVTLVLQVIMVEFLKKFADTTNLNWKEWLGCIGVASLTWPLGWFVKSIPVSDEPPLLDYLKRSVFKFTRITKIFRRTENSTSRLGLRCGKY